MVERSDKREGFSLEVASQCTILSLSSSLIIEKFGDLVERIWEKSCTENGTSYNGLSIWETEKRKERDCTYPSGIRYYEVVGVLRKSDLGTSFNDRVWRHWKEDVDSGWGMHPELFKPNIYAILEIKMVDRIYNSDNGPDDIQESLYIPICFRVKRFHQWRVEERHIV